MKKIILLSLFLALFLGGCSLAIPTSKTAKKILKPEEARIAAEKFINENLLPANTKATVKSAVLEGDIYNISLTVGGKDYTSYMTRDGAKFFQSGLSMATFAQDSKNQAAAQTGNTQAASSASIPKSDKPKVELFVMTYCPYGLQSEKGILPAFAALGNKIEAKVRFVHYFMHGDKEERETYNQVCLREEQAAKYNNYLNCFTLNGDSAKCAAQAGIDGAKLKNCLAAKAKDIYKSDSALSQGYGVQGSPTLVINGAQSEAGRDAASYLAAICAAFNQAPAECAKQLSSAAPVSGFGAGDSAASIGGAAAGCAQP